MVISVSLDTTFPTVFLLVSFDIALQIFVTFLFIKIIDDGLEIRWLGFEYLNLTASFSSSLYTRRLWLFGHDISTACSLDLDGMHYLNEIISLQSVTKNDENQDGIIENARPVLWFSIGNFNKDMDNNKHNNILESEKQVRPTSRTSSNSNTSNK
ncbi:unnamed protein product [Rhizophagus irregularis]|nr:unnamed protein product [Rhizophagus irregularis]